MRVNFDGTLPFYPTILSILLLAAAIGSGVVAGLMFAFSNTVMGALDRLPAGEAVGAMNAINVRIVNPYFLVLFLGTAVVSLLLIVACFVYPEMAARALTLSGGVSYLAGVIAVTVICNIPRNDALAKVAADSPNAAEAWKVYYRPWVGWNHVRMAAGLIAAVCFVIAFGEL